MSRWTLNRAGIINVYQYGDETLRFAGGRLLLRGVNGSGKSTAMNMLLPFLLDADTRRIDAAGEQSSVLRSWMLTGREEQQPQGYLWIEVAHRQPDGTDHHLSFGCGIRANRSTDRVSTWWFITAKRPGIDLHLVENRHTLSLDALRGALEPGAVYSGDRRGTYRTEIRNRLFAGADLDQHLRLLHVIRNPRVGDRIDRDLPSYLDDALPQLSETALDDAAQPLEDLEEHRRNVEDLQRTADALHAINGVYANHARTELHGAAHAAQSLLTDLDAKLRAERAATATQKQATEALAGATDTVATADADVRRFDEEIRALEASDAYRAGAELNDLRAHATSLGEQVTAAEGAATRQAEREGAAGDALRSADDDATRESATLTEQLDELTAHAAGVGLSVRPPDTPGIPTDPLGPDERVPREPLDTDAFTRGITELRGAAHHRLGDVDAVRSAHVAVARADTALAAAERDVEVAARDVTAAEGAFADSRAAVQAAVDAWDGAMSSWRTRFDDHVTTHRVDTEAPTLAATEPDAVHSHWLARTDVAVDEHRRRLAVLDAEQTAQQAVVDEAARRAAELHARTLPDPPLAWWQQRVGAPSLAELIAFRDPVTPAERAGLEAAMEAAGLLGAEVAQHEGGTTLRLGDGQLLAVSGPAAAAPLTDLLTVTDVDGLAGEITKALQQVLATISVDARQLDGLGATVVTTSGEFRIGALRGHHHKAAAEHIGLSARQAVLERQRAEADDELALAQSQLDVIGQRRTGAAGHVSDATTLRTDLPPIRDIVAAVGRSELAEEALGAARVRHDERQRARLTAEQAHADASDELQRIAATVGLPVDADALDDIRRTLDRLPNLADAASRAATSLTKAVGRWIDRGHDVQRARHDLETSETHLASVRDEHRQLQSRLATLEDSLGADYDQIVADIETSRVDLADARRRLALAHDGVGDAREAHARASEQHAAAVAARETADAQCIAALPHLHAVVEVPGLLVASHYTAEHADAPPPLPAVEQSADGLRHLARALLDAVPAPTPPGTTADGVRQSLRRRRDTLGAGWDVEDQQPDAEVPLRIEVTGPSGRSPLPQATEQVDARLRQMTSLLSAKQDQALRNLLQGLVAREVAEKLHAATELIARMNRRLTTITTSHGIGVSLRWRRRDDLDPHLAGTIDLLAKAPDLRTPDEDATLIAALSERIATARLDDPEQPYRELIAGVLDYRMWHEMSLVLRRPGRNDEKLTRRTALSEGEKKMVSYLPLFAAVAASCDALAERTPSAPRFLLLDDAFAKVSEDNHAKLFGLLVDLDLDFIATSERLWGTHSTVPELAITEVIRDADLGAIVLEHSHWDGQVTVSA